MPKAQSTKQRLKVLHLQNGINTIIKRRPEDRLWYQIVIKQLSKTDFQYEKEKKKQIQDKLQNLLLQQ